MKLTRKQKRNWIKAIKELDEKYPLKEIKVKDWNRGGFVDDEKYKQPIKHKKYK
jgi:hypothetical protein